MIDPMICGMLESMTVEELQSVKFACETAVGDSFDDFFEDFKRANAEKLNSHNKDASWFRDRFSVPETSCGTC